MGGFAPREGGVERGRDVVHVSLCHVGVGVVCVGGAGEVLGVFGEIVGFLRPVIHPAHLPNFQVV